MTNLSFYRLLLLRLYLLHLVSILMSSFKTLRNLPLHLPLNLSFLSTLDLSTLLLDLSIINLLYLRLSSLRKRLVYANLKSIYRLTAKTDYLPESFLLFLCKTTTTTFRTPTDKIR